MSRLREFRFAVLGVCLGVAIGGLIFSEINLSLASIRDALYVNVADLQWVINIYGIVVCSCLVIAGRLGDVLGRRRLYLIGLALLALSMLGMGLGQHIQTLWVSQILNGVASAIIMPVSQALITHIFPRNRRSKAIGMWAGSIGIALGIGPLYAGIVIHLLSWRWVFLLNIPVIMISFMMVMLYVKDSKTKEKTPQIDWLGALMLTIGLGAIVTAIIQAELWPWKVTLALLVLSMLAFYALFQVERHVAQPIIRQDLFTNRSFLLSSLCNSFLLWFIWSSFFLMPLYIQDILHMNPLYAGLIMLFVTTPLSLFSFWTERFYYHFGPKRLIQCGFIALVISSALQYFIQGSTAHVFMLFIIAAFIFGLGWGLIWNSSATKATSTLPRSHAGIASGTFVTFQEIGGTVGLAVTGAVARLSPHLNVGFNHGMIVLFIISIVGFTIACFMHRLDR